MKIPRSLIINGKRWRVVLKPLWHRHMYGQCVYRSRQIQIDIALPRAEKEETFLHELMHACWGKKERWGRAERREEHMIRRLSPRLLKALKNARAVR